MRRLIVLMVSLFAAASFAAVRAQQPTASPTPAPSPAATPAPKPLVPAAANSVATNPDAYYGENVTVTAAVQQVLSPLAFSVAQRTAGQTQAATTKDVLVIAPSLNNKVDPNSYVTVLGEVVKFDPAEIAKKAKDYKLDLPPDVVEKYRGKPVVVATSVLNSAMVDLAKRLPPPMTAEEENYSKMMKRVGPAFAALRTATDASNAAAAAENTTVLKQAFTDTEAFWKARKKDDAAGWALDARKQVETIAASASTGKWDAAKAAAGTLGQACQTCHGAYRERLDDGSYRIKAGSR
jgi:cytochrome c556